MGIMVSDYGATRLAVRVYSFKNGSFNDIFRSWPEVSTGWPRPIYRKILNLEILEREIVKYFAPRVFYPSAPTTQVDPGRSDPSVVKTRIT